jgi:hypothetical protein
MTIEYTNKAITLQPTPTNEQLYCALTGVPVDAATAYWAPPLVTAGQLVRAVINGLLHSPGTLSHMLFDEMPNVPYAPAVRDRLAARRSSEQVKLLVGMLVSIALVAVPIILLAMR